MPERTGCCTNLGEYPAATRLSRLAQHLGGLGFDAFRKKQLPDQSVVVGRKHTNYVDAVVPTQVVTLIEIYHLHLKRT